MTSDAASVDEYIKELPEDRKAVISELRSIINDNLPEGYEECMSYGMIGWVVPKSTYPDGYHCTPELPLPFMNLASQKRHIGLYHSGIYASDELMQWFVDEWPKHMKNKLNMGKSCIRFTNPSKIPFELIAQLCTKMTVKEWISLYESKVKN